MTRIATLLDSHENIMSIIVKYETALIESEGDVVIAGKTLEDANKEQGILLVKYARLHAEARNVVRLLEARGESIRARKHKDVKRTSDLALNDRTIDKYVEGDQDVLDHVALIIEVRALEEKLAAVVEAIKMRGYALNNITRARVESVHMAVL